MAQIAFLPLYATGHINPSLTLARGLRERGHEVVFFNIPDVAGAIEGAGFRFAAYGAAEYPAGSLKATMETSAGLTGAAAFGDYVQRMVRLFRAGFTDLPEMLTAFKPDLLVVDQVLYSGATIAEHLRLPFVSLANALLVNREDGIPPPVMLWPYDDSEAGKERNRKGWAGVDQAYAHLLALVNAQREAWGLAAYTNLVEDSFSPLAQICQQPKIFDFPRPQAPPTLYRVGHFQDTTPREEVSFPWEWLDGRPLIYASCGTLNNRQEPVFRAVIAACAPLDAQTVIALGAEGLAPSLFGEVPSNVKLVRYAPQNPLIERAALCITHAGLNTTLDCLQAGVPMVAVPLASEQPGIAMRMARLGAGVVVPLAELSAEKLGSATRTVLEGTKYREAARGVARELAGLRPVEEAVRVVEQVLGRSA